MVNFLGQTKITPDAEDVKQKLKLLATDAFSCADAAAHYFGCTRKKALDIICHSFLMSAKKEYGDEFDIKIHVSESGEVETYQFMEVVEDVENECAQLSLENARRLAPNSKIGNWLGKKVPTVLLEDDPFFSSTLFVRNVSFTRAGATERTADSGR